MRQSVQTAGTELRQSMQDWVGDVLRLALGRGVAVGADANWPAIYQIAVAERCAVLAWQRSAALMRAACPPDVLDDWRSYAVNCAMSAERMLARLAEAVGVLEGGGLHPVVLKGIPLSFRLYGEIGVRPVSDIDLFLPPSERASARRLLGASGWRHGAGEAPWDEIFLLRGADPPLLLEVHSSLVTKSLGHLPAVPPDVERSTIGGHSLPVLGGPLLPAYLAAHLARHSPSPLLWFVDFMTLWSSLGVAGREQAVRAAKRAGLAGYVRWASHRAGLLEPAAGGDRTALRAFGYRGNARRELHAIFRDVALAQSPVRGARAAAAWLLPPELRGSWRRLAWSAVHRLGTRWRELFVRAWRYHA